MPIATISDLPSCASPAGGQGGNASPIFVFAPPPPPIYFLPPTVFFLGGRRCFFWPEKTLKFVISVKKSLRISAKTFFYFLEITCFWPEKKTLKFRPEKAFENRRKPLPPDFNFAPPPPISRSWRRPCLPSYDIFVSRKVPRLKIFDDVIACDLCLGPPNQKF